MLKSLKTVKEAERYLLAYSPPMTSGESYTLDRMQMLMERLGNLQNQLRVIHVAGTSGKTSTAYYIRALLEASGKKTGLTASPHITSITERVQVFSQPLGDNDFLAYLNEFLSILESWNDIRPTYFELMIAFAYWVFVKENVDYAVIEVGLGGTLDATNVVSRTDKICVITPISLDHTRVLGDTEEKIATQKAGIITAKNHIFMADQQQGVQSVIESVAQNTNAILHGITEQGELPSDMPKFQQENFALARTVFEYVRSRDNLAALTNEQLAASTHKTPPGRFETYTINGKTIIFDGAHNPQKLRALRESLPAGATNSSVWLVGFIQAPEEKINTCLDELQEQSSRFILTEFSVGQDIRGRQSVRAGRLSALAKDRGMDSVTVKNPEKAMSLALSGPETYVIVTGSLYLVAKLRSEFLKYYIEAG